MRLSLFALLFGLLTWASASAAPSPDLLTEAPLPPELAAPLSSGRVLYVRTDGSNSRNGLSWTNAKATPAAALDGARVGDQVWVARGVYWNSQAVVPAGVQLYGGFAGSESSLGQRNWPRNQTILDGGGCVSILRMSAGPPQRVDGFILRRGSRAITTDFASPVIVNNRIVQNRGAWGAGIVGSGSSPSIVNNLIADNHSVGDGGGILFALDSRPFIGRNIITRNRAQRAEGRSYGGGLFFWRCAEVRLVDNRITRNWSAGDAGGIGFMHDTTLPDLTVAGNHVEHNVAEGAGGGIFLSWGREVDINRNLVRGNVSGVGMAGMHLHGPSRLSLRHNQVIGNTSGFQGGVGIGECGDLTVGDNLVRGNQGGVVGGLSVWNSRGVVERNRILENSGGTVGGLNVHWAPDVTIRGNTISGNASENWAGIHWVESSAVFYENRVTENHGGLGCTIIAASSVVLESNLFAANRGSPGGRHGIRLVGSDAVLANNTLVDHRAPVPAPAVLIHSSTLRLINNLVAFNDAGISAQDGVTATQDRNCFHDNSVGNYFGIPAGETDFFADPLVADRATGNYRLAAVSPCVDAGDSSHVPSGPDLDGRPRLVGATIDVGAFEFNPAGQQAPTAPAEVQARAQGGGIAVTWIDTSDREQEYQVIRSVNGGPYRLLAAAPARPHAGPAMFFDAGVAPHRVYRYRVRARNSAGNSAFSGEAMVQPLPLGGVVASPAGVGFGEVPVGSTLTRTLPILNRSDTEDLVVRVFPPPAPYQILQGEGTHRLSPGESLIVIVRFAPTAAAAARANLFLQTTDRERTRARVILAGSGL
jgi:hypothetical protein